MSSGNRVVAPLSSVSLAGLLAVISGLGLLLVLSRFDAIVNQWGAVLRLSLFAIGVYLLFWGLKQTATAIFWSGSDALRLRRPSKQRVLLPREGLMYLGIMAVLFVGSLLGRSNMLMLVFAMMAGPFVLNGWITFSLLKQIHVRRRAPVRAMAGELVSVEIQIENGKRWVSSWLMAVRDRISSDREQLDASVLFGRVPPRGSGRGFYQMRLAHRGKYLLGPIEVTTRFPLGLVERGRNCDVTDTILIHPRVGRLTSKWKREMLAAAELVHRQKTRAGSFNDEFHRLREYRWGDSSSAIHWRTSARRNELMVREYHQSRDQHLAVLLDLWQPKSPNAVDAQRAELAISFAATVCVEHLKQNRDSNLLLVTSGDTVMRWESQMGFTSVDSMLDVLAVVKAGVSGGIEQTIDESLQQQAANTRTIVITTRSRDDWDAAGLRQYVSNGSLSEYGGHLRLIESDSRELASLFALSTDGI